MKSLRTRWLHLGNAGPRSVTAAGTWARPKKTKAADPFEDQRLLKLAGWTGLEPATFCVTGRRSNQLSYHPVDRERARTLGSTKGESSAVFPLSAKSRRRIPPVAFAVVAQPDRATVF